MRRPDPRRPRSARGQHRKSADEQGFFGGWGSNFRPDRSSIPSAIAILDLHQAAATDLDRSPADLVAEHARANPDAIAIEDGDARLTYAELDAAGAGIA